MASNEKAQGRGLCISCQGSALKLQLTAALWECGRPSVDYLPRDHEKLELCIFRQNVGN